MPNDKKQVFRIPAEAAGGELKGEQMKAKPLFDKYYEESPWHWKLYYHWCKFQLIFTEAYWRWFK